MKKLRKMSSVRIPVTDDNDCGFYWLCAAEQLVTSPIQRLPWHVRNHVSIVSLHLMTTLSPFRCSDARAGGVTSGHPSAGKTTRHPRWKKNNPRSGSWSESPRKSNDLLLLGRPTPRRNSQELFDNSRIHWIVAISQWLKLPLISYIPVLSSNTTE